MFSMAVLVYFLAIGISVYLLHQFHSQAWYWHALTIVGGMGIGLIPVPPQWQRPGLDLVFGFMTGLLLVWSLGGLMRWRPRQEKHA